jgi:light-harvesting complex 1 beta chain
MNDITTVSTTSQLLHSKGDGTLFLLSFVFVLLVALVAQVLFLKWRGWFPGAESEKSLFKSVRAGVYTFMSHLN